MPVLCPPHPSLPHTTTTYNHAYLSILQRSRAAQGRLDANGLVIMVSNDVDGVLGARMLTNLLANDGIPHRVFPVGGYDELFRRMGELEGKGELHTLVLLSFGSVTNISQVLLSRVSPSVHIHVLDSRRPWNLANLFGSSNRNRVWVWDDFYDDPDNEEAGGSSASRENDRKAFEAMEFEEEDSDDDSDSDDDEDEEEDEEDEDEEDEEETEEEEEEDEDGNVVVRKKPKAPKSPKKKKRKLSDGEGDPSIPKPLTKSQKRQHLARIDKYYMAGTHFGTSVSGCLYMLANGLGREDNDLLWLAILGLTHQYISSRIDRDRYDGLQLLFLDEVARLNPPPTNMPGVPGQTNGKLFNPDDSSIKSSEELRFTLYRHWNLYDSMFHSGYVASKMGIWKDKGRKRLQGLFAKMGFSLIQCQQAYAHMNTDLKSQLHKNMDTIGPEYGLVEVSYPSFTRSFGFQSLPLSAADFVEGIGALLEAAEGVRMEVEIEGGKGGGEWFGGSRIWALSGMGGTVGEDKRKGEEEKTDDAADQELDEDGNVIREKKSNQSWENCFWAAFDALHPGGNVSLIRASLPLCMALQRAIIRQGSSLIDKQAVKNLRSFRLSVIKDGPDVALFCNASTLSRLALWMVDTLRDRIGGSTEQRKKNLPVVMACLNEQLGRYVVVAVNGAPEFGDVRKNKFGAAFLRASSATGAQTNNDFFDTNIVEVEKDDLTPFIEALVEELRERR